MSDGEVLIRAEHVSKKFCRSLKRSLWYGAQDVANSLMPWKRDPGSTGANEDMVFREPELRNDEFWAVRDVSFEVRRGECLGLIGHNGAGKSTLLKMLNSLNRPDSGRITMKGRVGALIELNAGFNPILTGRENIYNQAALLGFSSNETDAKFDAIVDFSELEDFLDMPVQNYSSGMRVRLGFAVSSQMEPDILLIDEVLAVGDVGFRFKCLNTMAELQRKCAFIFVSHSMPQVMRVAKEIMVLQSGTVHYQGRDLGQGLHHYLNLFSGGEITETGSGEVSITKVTASSTGGVCGRSENLSSQYGEKLSIRFSLETELPPGSKVVVQTLFWNQEMIPVLDVFERDGHGFAIELKKKYCEVSFEIDHLPLNAGRYKVSLIVTHPNLERVYCQLDNAIGVTVSSGNYSSGAGCLVEANWACT